MLHTKIETKPTILSENLLNPLFPMKFTLANNTEGNLFSATEADWVEVRGVRYSESLVMGPDFGPLPWAPRFEGLTAADFEALLEWRPALLVFGSGSRFRLPHPRLSAGLLTAGVGLEAMDTRAACRTYNVLVSEGRRAVIALLQGE